MDELRNMVVQRCRLSDKPCAREMACTGGHAHYCRYAPLDKRQRNQRTQARYDELMREGKHGHYETMGQVIYEEVRRTLLTAARVAETEFEDRQHRYCADGAEMVAARLRLIAEDDDTPTQDAEPVRIMVSGDLSQNGIEQQAIYESISPAQKGEPG